MLSYNLSFFHSLTPEYIVAYRATMPYLIEQGNSNATWTLITGAAAELGGYGVTAMGQGALISMANVACRETDETNVRFNECFLGCRVDYDSTVDETGDKWRNKASHFARVYEGILANKEIAASRVTVRGPQDFDDLSYKKKLQSNI